MPILPILKENNQSPTEIQVFGLGYSSGGLIILFCYIYF